MGDRGNIVVIDEYNKGQAVYLYSHWDGYNLPGILGQALDSKAGRGRWSDGSYLTRIIFDAMIKDDQGGETGYGISTRLTDNEYPLLVVDPQQGRVALREPTASPAINHAPILAPEGWSFEEFIKADPLPGWM